jgi:hypothetical protein
MPLSSTSVPRRMNSPATMFLVFSQFFEGPSSSSNALAPRGLVEWHRFLGAILLALIKALKKQGAAEAKVEMDRQAAEVEREMSKVVMKERTTAKDIKRLAMGHSNPIT